MDVVDYGRSLDQALISFETEVPDHRRPLLHEMCYGACRFYYFFDGVLRQLLDKPLKSRDRVVHFILISVCYQLAFMRTPDHAAVSQGVASVAGTRFAWTAGLINGVLRNFIRRRKQLESRVEPVSSRFSFPPWLYREICRAWPDDYATILESSNRKPPLTLRINPLKSNRRAYLDRLADHGMSASCTDQSELGITLGKPAPVSQLPGFAEGMVSVQDESAQLALAALEPAKGERILDGLRRARRENLPAAGGRTHVGPSWRWIYLIEFRG